MNKIPRVNFLNDDLDCIMAGLALDNVKEVVFDKLIPNLKLSIEKNKKECIFCTVEDYNIIIPQSSYGKVLEVLEKYYLSKENYEVCAKIKELQDKL